MVDVVGRYQHQLGQFIDDRVANDLNITAAKRAQTLEQLQRFVQGMQQNRGCDWRRYRGPPAQGAGLDGVDLREVYDEGT